jgi:7,8-dihydropterin-6-yl-methyl-4-(beta-D-ribofuranosyl)aminobenzene 5'-phosphate synthase
LEEDAICEETHLREIDRLEVTILLDNYTDSLLMQNTEVVKRALAPPPNWPLAEHGFSCLLKVSAGSEEHAVLMDAGVTPISLPHNAKILNKNLSEVESFILSHGHFDHFGGLMDFLNRAGKQMPLILHNDAFLERRLNIPGVGASLLPSLNEAKLKEMGAVIKKINKPSTIASDTILVSGEVERAASFERGFPMAEAKINGKWVPDPFKDDLGIAVNVKDEGLVVISGCAHAGIVNTVKHIQKVTGTNKVNAIMGGFHLTRPMFDPIIEPTITELKKINPNMVIPMHCTGWKAINQFAKEMPQQFILNSVGTTYTFK